MRGAIYDGEQPNTHGIPTRFGADALVMGEVELDGWLKLGAWHHTGLGNAYYGVVDRHLGGRLGAFARAGVMRDAPIELYVDAGVRFGPGPWRPRDFVRTGIAFVRSEAGAQTVVELTYQVLVEGWLTIQPDLQLVLTREGATGVISTRAVIAF